MRAFDGEEALSLAVRNAPAMLIVDAMMPKLSGVEVIRRLKEQQRTVSIPSILMSCVLQEPGNSGASHFVPKPFDLETIVGLVRQHAGDPRAPSRSDG